MENTAEPDRPQLLKHNVVEKFVLQVYFYIFDRTYIAQQHQIEHIVAFLWQHCYLYL